MFFAAFFCCEDDNPFNEGVCTFLLCCQLLYSGLEIDAKYTNIHLIPACTMKIPYIYIPGKNAVNNMGWLSCKHLFVKINPGSPSRCNI